jgi:hypothetical protein
LYRAKYALVFIFSLVCLVIDSPPVAGQSSKTVPVTVQTLPLTRATTCSGHFVAYDLDHKTTVPDPKNIRMYQGNGEGVAIGDLDNDGKLDIVLANYSGPNTILWNEGELKFTTAHLSEASGDSRAVTIVDVDGDGKLDIVLTRTKNAPTYWHNDGNRHFTREYLPGVGKPLYTINWADMTNSGYLDLVGATYDTSLLADFGQEFLNSGNGGVYYYQNKGGQFVLHTLATSAQALALLLVDLNGDGHPDLWVGNDFAVPDQTWLWTQSSFQRSNLLTISSYSTMSLDFGDLNNDGRNEVFSTDMKPYPGDKQGQTVMPAILKGLTAPRTTNDPQQVTANVLQTVGVFEDTAKAAGVDATGWSWSAKFADLDNDGFLDLYVVNGFMEFSTFPRLPNHELVEENQAFKNVGNGNFVRMSEWGLGSTRSGRGMSMADLAGDGRLDIVVNNVNGNAQLFENQLCGGNSLEVDLFWPGSHNSRAIGSTLILSSDTANYYRDVKAASGYLSGDPVRIHFGYPQGAMLRQLQVRWPDGAMSVVNTPTDNSILEVTRGN